MRDDIPDKRVETDESRADLAAAVGVTRQTIDAIKRERYDPSLEPAFGLADHFDCRIEDVFAPDD